MSIPEAEPHARGASELYDASYYAHYYSEGDRVAYERREPWLSFFAAVAERIVADIAPSSALDIGCAHGFLVEALRDRGVDASGFDVSEFAISQVREDVRPHCRVGDVLQPIPGRYDLVVCIEVLEHLEERDADVAVANICAVTDDVLFTSTPVDYREETHVNVRPPEYWAGLFARHGFARDLSFDGSFLAWWAQRFRKAREPWHRLAVDYERECWRLKGEARERNSVVLTQRSRIDELERELAALTASTARSELERLSGELEESRARLAESLAALAAYRGSTAVRLALQAHDAVGRAAPAGTLRGGAVSAVAGRVRGLGRRGGRTGGPDPEPSAGPDDRPGSASR